MVVMAGLACVQGVPDGTDPVLPVAYDVPCWTEARDQFMWLDFRCHSIRECGDSGVDWGRMVEYNEKNTIAPAQGCACLAQQRSRRLQGSGLMTDIPQYAAAGLLPDNCGGCAGTMPLDERNPSSTASGTGCRLAPRGDVAMVVDSEYGYSDAFDGVRPAVWGDFACWGGTDAGCEDTSRASVDRFWASQTGIARRFHLYSWNWWEATTRVVDPLARCGAASDLALTVETGRCRCSRNADAYPLTAFNVNHPDTMPYCPVCKAGYYQAWGNDDWRNVCHRRSMACEDPSHMLLTSTLEAHELGLSAGDSLYRCVDPEAPGVCKPNTPLYYNNYVDGAASIEAGRCVCSNPNDRRAFGGYDRGVVDAGASVTLPDYPELGPQHVCGLCNNEAGYWRITSILCLKLEDFHPTIHTSLFDRVVLGGARLQSGLINSINTMFYSIVHDDPELPGVGSGGNGIMIFSPVYERLWPPWPSLPTGDEAPPIGAASWDDVSTTITDPWDADAGMPVRAKLAYDAGSASASAWLAGHLHRAADTTTEFVGEVAPYPIVTRWPEAYFQTRLSREITTNYLCGQAAAPAEPATHLALRRLQFPPLRCTCLPHASIRWGYTHKQSSEHCFCDSGFVFDPAAVRASDGLLGDCVDVYQHCGPGAHPNITQACACTDRATRSLAWGKCDTCIAGRFKPLEHCPSIRTWCDAPAADEPFLDTVVSHETDVCTCRPGFLPFLLQRDGLRGCHSCTDPALVPDEATQGCVSVFDKCVVTASAGGGTGAQEAAQEALEARIDINTTVATGVCTCLRGWIGPASNACHEVPANHWADAATDTVRPFVDCGPGVHEADTAAAGECVCDTGNNFNAAVPCTTCAPGYIFLSSPGDSTPGTCVLAQTHCGGGIDVDTTVATQRCACLPNFLDIADQPTGRCEDCKPSHTRRTMTQCTPLGEAERWYRGVPLGLDAWEDLLDRAFENGVAGFTETATGACDARWTFSPPEPFAFSRFRLQLPPSSGALMKTVSHRPDEAKAACHAFFPCTGFLQFQLATLDDDTPVYFFVYTTYIKQHWDQRFTSGSVDAMSEDLPYMGMWDLERYDAAACSSPTVDPGWYWSAWNARLQQRASHIPNIAFSAATLAAMPNSVGAALAEPSTVLEHFWWVGHLAHLWPNPRCHLGPIRADPNTGCRAQTCPTFTTCPPEFPVDTGVAAASLLHTTPSHLLHQREASQLGDIVGAHLCALPGTVLVQNSTVATVYADSSWSHMDDAGMGSIGCTDGMCFWSNPDDHPRPCQAGACVYDIDSTDAGAATCSCPGVGTDGIEGSACDTAVSTTLDEGTGECVYPLLSPNEVALCSKAAPVTGECPPGSLLYGPDCGTLDVDGACHNTGLDLQFQAGETEGGALACSGHGVCAQPALPASPRCDCEAKWTGAFCDIPACADDCGDLGRCIAVTVAGVVTYQCACAVDAVTGEALALATVDGRCTIDLCNDHLGDTDVRRFGSLVLDEGGGLNIHGAPLGSCKCTANSAGLLNSGTFCDQTSCVAGCGLAGGADAPGFNDVCIPCSNTGRMSGHPQCRGQELGAVCDCAATTLGDASGSPYWEHPFKPWRFVAASAGVVVAGDTFEVCTPYCSGDATWSPTEQQCVCHDHQWKGAKCDVPGCPHGVYSPAHSGCTSCDDSWALTYDDAQAGVCQTCDERHMHSSVGDDCGSCSFGFFHLLGGAGSSEACVTCDEAVDLVCIPRATESHECANGYVACTCHSGYEGPGCGSCAPGFWRVTADRLPWLAPYNETTHGTLRAATNWTWPGACAPLETFTGCDRHAPGRIAPGMAPARIEQVPAPLAGAPNDAVPRCNCAAAYDGRPEAVAWGNGSYPGDCTLCMPGTNVVQNRDTNACVPCAAALGCDAVGTVSAECLNPGEELGGAASNGLRNECVCDMAIGRGGELCSECDAASKWAPVPNTEPLQCHRCTLDCGPNGEVMCGIGVSACRCRGAWSGPQCDQCPYCGQGGHCTQSFDFEDIDAQGNAWCTCDAKQGFAKNAAVLASPFAHKAACTSCQPGFLLQGIVCRPIAEVCGRGTDHALTLAAGACVCAEGYLPLHWQPGTDCTVCAEHHFSVARSTPGPNGTTTTRMVCETCDVECPPNAECAWSTANARPECVCISGFQETNGDCSACRFGFTGPTCSPCDPLCVDSGGTCVWDTVDGIAECVCPAGMTHRLPNNPASPCRSCMFAGGLETGDHCMPCPTCPANAHCIEPGAGASGGASESATCACDDGFERPPGSEALFTDCALPEVVTDVTTTPETTPLFSRFNSPTLLVSMGIMGAFMALLACVIVAVSYFSARAAAPKRVALSAGVGTGAGADVGTVSPLMQPLLQPHEHDA